jgi:hypothetical protein
LYVPGLHRVQLDVAPAQRVPGSQTEHTLAPNPIEYWPGMHFKHCGDPGSGLYVPGSHRVQLAAPSAE